MSDYKTFIAAESGGKRVTFNNNVEKNIEIKDGTFVKIGEKTKDGESPYMTYIDRQYIKHGRTPPPRTRAPKSFCSQCSIM